jgi:hypothetical protein
VCKKLFSSLFDNLTLIVEDANDLLNEGVTKIPKSGYKLSRVSHSVKNIFSYEILLAMSNDELDLISWSLQQ